MKTLEITCLSEALSPITHMAGTAGNEAIIAREKVLTPSGERFIPFLSGNALRHRAVREPGMLWLIQEYDLIGKLSIGQVNFLLHGGNLTESNAVEDLSRIADLHRTWPLIRLLGGALPDLILHGSLDVRRGVLVCEENRPFLSYAPRERLSPAESFISEYRYTRGDAAKSLLHDQRPGALPTGSNLMLYSGQCVNRGAVFEHGFVLKHVSDLEIGALLWSLQLWQDAGGTIGSQACKGHGVLRTWIVHTSQEIDADGLMEKYVAYAGSVREEAIESLRRCWR